MVTLYGLLPEARFTPEDVNVTSRGRLFRPIGIVPLSPTWSSQQLDAHEQAVAIYLFDEGISFRDALTVSYQTQSNDSWSRAVSALDRERARVLARAASKPGPCKLSSSPFSSSAREPSRGRSSAGAVRWRGAKPSAAASPRS
jgi:hypothetical protein